MTKNGRVRPIFFAPWWFFVWGSGKRFSLRRSLTLAVGVVLAIEVVTAAARFAFGGLAPTLASLVATARWAALASSCYSLAEPPLFVIAESARAGRLQTQRLRDVSYGFQLAYAAALAFAAFAFAPRSPDLASLLHHARLQNGTVGGNARFLIGATIVAYPVVIFTRLLLLRNASSAAIPQPTSYAAGEPIQPVHRHRLESDTVATPIVTVDQRPARILRVDVGPAKPLDPP